MDAATYRLHHLPMAKIPRRPTLARRVWRRIYLAEGLEVTGKTQRQVAEATGISESHLSLIASGKRQYTQQNLERIAEQLRIEPGELLYPPDRSPLGRLILQMTQDEREQAARVIAAIRAGR